MINWIKTGSFGEYECLSVLKKISNGGLVLRQEITKNKEENIMPVVIRPITETLEKSFNKPLKKLITG